MQGFLILFAVCVLGAHAIPRPVIRQDPQQGRVGGNPPANAAAHACMVLVNRVSLNGTNTAALGGGSIISATHVLTAAHLIQGNNTSYQVGFLVNGVRRMLTATFALFHQNYLNTDFSSDVGIIFLQGANTFPLANVIRITDDQSLPGSGDAGKVVGFGFTAANSTGASSDPYEADQTVVDDCTFTNFNLSDTHFCAIDSTAATWVCPGDNGAGFFTGDTTGTADDPHILLGIVSRVLTGCATAQNTGFTQVALFADWIGNITGTPIQTLAQNFNIPLYRLQ